MIRAIALVALLTAAPAAADGCRYPCDEDPAYYQGPFYGDPRWAQPPLRQPPQMIPPGVPHGAVTPMGEVAYPLRPGHVQAPPELRKAFPRGIPPALLD